MDNWLKNNNVIKILSLVLALMLWMVVTMDTNIPNKKVVTEGNEQNTYLYEANVQPLYDEGKYVVKLDRQRVNVTLIGEKELLNAMRNKDNIDKGQIFVDLKDAQPGALKVPVKYAGFPKEIKVEIEPKEIDVKIEAKHVKEITVIVDKLGKEDEGFQAGDPIVKPKKVHISGTKEEVEQVAFVKAFVSIDNVQGPILKELPLRAIDKNGNVIPVEITPQAVEVQIPVTSPYKIVPLTFRVGNFPKDVGIKLIEQITKEVVLYGPEEVISKYSVYNGPELDLSTITEDQTIEVRIHLEEGLLKVEPETVEFRVDVGTLESKTITQVPVEISGLNNGLEATIIDPVEGASITIQGESEVLSQITKDDLQAFVNVTNLPPGEYELPIQYNVPLLTEQTDADNVARVRIIKVD